ncbi:MAG: hypothetical protein AAF432_16355 [Planctomycetota bacterium]
MAAVLTVYDETTTGDRTAAIELTFPTEQITIRELIRERVYQEVHDHNVQRRSTGVFRGLVRPTDAEATLNGYKLKKPREIDWRPQFEAAIDAFERNQILVLVDAQQADSLEQSIEVSHGTDVTFLRLTPLVGG